MLSERPSGMGLQVLFIFTRRHVHQSAKDQPKVTLIAKTDLLTHFGNGFIRCNQHGLRSGDAEMIQVGDEGLPRHLPEKSHEMRLAHANY